MSQPPMVGDGVVESLQRALGRLSTRASVAAANLANVDTPGYRALRAEFPAELDRAMSPGLERTDGRHLPPSLGGFDRDPQLVPAPVSRSRMDGNTVDVDREMTELSAVQGRFTAAARMIRKRFALLLYTVTDGKR